MRGMALATTVSTARRSGPIDVLAEVRSGDAVLVPHGWHGPSMAAPGYDLYYLNVMAGPGDDRAWATCDDPAHAWVRGTWDGQSIDPRVAADLGHRKERAHDDRRERRHRAAHGRPGRGAVSDPAAQRARRSRAPAVRRAASASSVTATSRASVRPCWSSDGGGLRYYQARNEQAMVHASVAFARMRNRLTTMACTASVGPGSTNMVTGAALATINRLPVLLLPSDTFATRAAEPGAAGARGARRRGRVGQRRLPPGVPLLRSGVAARAAARGAPRGDASADRPGADRRGDPRSAAGRADRGVRLAGRAVRQAGVARAPSAARPGRSREGDRAGPLGPPAAGRGRRRRRLQRGHRGPARFRRGDRDPGRGDPGRQGVDALRPSAGTGCDRQHGLPRPPTRSPGPPTW